MSEISITRRELLELWHGLQSLGELKGFKLGYAVARTKAKIRLEVEALEESLKPAKDFQEYDEKRMEVCNKYAKKDAQDKPVVSGNEYVFGENRAEFEQALAPIQEEYAAAIEERKKQLEDYTVGLKDKITVEIHQIAVEDVPEDVNVDQMGTLYYLVAEK